jgi:hypothetical protein
MSPAALPPRWARAADVIAVLLGLLALYVAIEGGMLSWIGHVRVSVRSAWRPAAWALGLLALRHLIVRRPALHEWIVDGILEAAKKPGPLPSDTPAPPRLPSSLPRPAARYRRWARQLSLAVGVVALYSALTAVLLLPQVRQLSSGLSVETGDPLFSVWRLSWMAHQFPRDPLHLYDGNIFHPERFTLAYSDSMVVTGLMAAPLYWLGVPRITAYNLIFLSAFALSGAAMFLLVRSLTHHTAAALIAGFLFAFLPYRFMHYSHLELQMAHWMPLSLWALHRTFDRGRLVDGLLTGLFIALQTLSSWYYGIFFVTYLVPFALVLLFGEGLRRPAASLRALAAGACLSALLVAPFAVPYFEARQIVGERDTGDTSFYSATPVNYLAAHPRNAAYGWLTAKWGGQERELFQGFAVLLIALVGLWPPLSTVRMAYAIALLIAFEISLGFNGFLFSGLHSVFLPYRGLRVPARMAILVGFSLAVLSGFGVARICRQMKTRKAAITAAVLLAAVAAVEYWPKVVVAPISTRPPSIYAQLPSDAPVVLVELPLVRPDIAYEPYYMYFSTFHWHPLVNGYSGFSPPSYSPLVDAMASFPSDDSIAELRRRGVTHVVVHGAFFPRPEHYDRMIARLDESADLDFVAAGHWYQHKTRLYRLLPQTVSR